MRVFLDANILISYLLNPNGTTPNNVVVESAWAGSYTLIVAEPLFQELINKATHKPWLVQRIAQQDVQRLVDAVRVIAEIVPSITEPIPSVTRDPKDDYILAYALVGQADYLVTGDDDLLVLKHVGVMKIVRPHEFVELNLV